MRLLFLLLLLCTPLALRAEPGIIHYVNPRYGFAVDLPADFRPLAPPENGDGQVFEAADKMGRITVYGSNNISEHSLKAAATAQESGCGAKITYRARGKNWFVHSWTADNRISYLKCFVGKGSLNSILLEYPRTQARSYDGVVKRLESNFKAGDLSQSH